MLWLATRTCQLLGTASIQRPFHSPRSNWAAMSVPSPGLRPPMRPQLLLKLLVYPRRSELCTTSLSSIGGKRSDLRSRTSGALRNSLLSASIPDTVLLRYARAFRRGVQTLYQSPKASSAICVSVRRTRCAVMTGMKALLYQNPQALLQARPLKHTPLQPVPAPPLFKDLAAKFPS